MTQNQIGCRMIAAGLVLFALVIILDGASL